VNSDSTDQQQLTASKSAATSRVQFLVVTPLLIFSLYQLVQATFPYFKQVPSGPGYENWSPGWSKIRRADDQQFLWAKGPRDPEQEASEWFDMTGSPLELEQIDHGIGRDTIASIDDPVFVAGDDRRLLEHWDVDYPEELDDLRVIGYVHGGEARAYPIGLLNRHELVNDTVGGKPVTVGW
jgi:hypothetical protein